MKFGLSYEISVPKPWTPESERQVFMDCLEQVQVADEEGIVVVPAGQATAVLQAAEARAAKEAAETLDDWEAAHQARIVRVEIVGGLRAGHIGSAHLQERPVSAQGFRPGCLDQGAPQAEASALTSQMEAAAWQPLGLPSVTVTTRFRM